MKNITNMKNIVKQIILLWFCLLCGMSYGQGTGALYSNGIDGWQNMIRCHIATGKRITYSWAAMGWENHFALTDIHNNMTDAHVANGYYVQDFEIIGDYVFFCGYNASMSGFLGWFNINDVFNYPPTDRAYIDETLNAYGIEWLDNIEVYYDSFGRIHIAGVGQNMSSGTTIFKAFEAVGYTPSNMQYKVADLHGCELTPKPIVTDDYVVYATPERNLYSVGIGYSLEPFPKDDMFALPSHSSYLFQTVVAGSSLYPSESDPYTSFGITHKEKNVIAICNYRCDIIPPNSAISNTFKLVLREYDLSPLLSNNPIQMISDYKLKFTYGVNWIRRLAYDPMTKHYITLLRNETSLGNYEDGIIALDYSSGTAPTIAQATYQQAYPNGYLWDVCLDRSSKYTASGFDLTNYTYYFWHDDIISYAFPCANYEYYSVYPSDTEVVKEEEYMPDVLGWIVLNYVPNREVVLNYDNNTLNCN